MRQKIRKKFFIAHGVRLDGSVKCNLNLKSIYELESQLIGNFKCSEIVQTVDSLHIIWNSDLNVREKVLIVTSGGFTALLCDKDDFTIRLCEVLFSVQDIP